jgi:hypothetical protein|tara:strand:+ start:38 stop:355 length:318 start_codon:yes stop_codon:yes gene_type:complete
MFKLNFNKSDRNALTAMAVLMALIVVLSFMNAKTSKYQPRPIKIVPVSEESLFGLKPELDCVAGSGKKDSPYSVGLTPGGLCGAQKLVSAHAGYEIEDGIGGSLI